MNCKVLPGSSDCTKEECEQREPERRTRRKRWVNYLLEREAEAKLTGILNHDNESCCQSLKQPSPKEQNGSEGLGSSYLGKGVKNRDFIHDKEEKRRAANDKEKRGEP